MAAASQPRFRRREVWSRIPMLKLDPKDLLGGALLIALGAYVLQQAFVLGIGTPVRMGAGYFPLLLGASAMLLGCLIFAAGLRQRGTIPAPAWKPLIAVLAGILSFYLLVGRTGLIPAIAALVAIASLADEAIRGREWWLLTLGASLGGWLLFSVLLGLPLPGIRGWF
jgi:hypothetical protein